MSESLNILCVVNFSIALVLLQISSFSTAYELKKVEIPEDGTDVKFFTEEEIAKYDGSNVSRKFWLGQIKFIICFSSWFFFFKKWGERLMFSFQFLKIINHLCRFFFYNTVRIYLFSFFDQIKELVRWYHNYDENMHL